MKTTTTTFEVDLETRASPFFLIGGLKAICSTEAPFTRMPAEQKIERVLQAVADWEQANHDCRVKRVMENCGYEMAIWKMGIPRDMNFDDTP